MDRTGDKSSIVGSNSLSKEAGQCPDQKMRLPKSGKAESEESFAPVAQTPEKEEEDTVHQNDGSAYDGVPYDTGWAWVVLVGCFVNYILLAGYLKCLSVFYVELLHRFEAQATEAALIFSVRAGVFSVSSLFVMNVWVGHLGERRTVLIGAMMMSLSAILSSLASDMMLIICLQGGLLGLGQAMLLSPGEVLMGAYFTQRRRSLAISLAKCGSSLGNILMPPLITYFLEHFGLSGALLLTGALCLHCIPAAMLLRPTSFFRMQPNTAAECYETSSAAGHRESDEARETTAALLGNERSNRVDVETKNTLQNMEFVIEVSHEERRRSNDENTIPLDVAVVVSNSSSEGEDVTSKQRNVGVNSCYVERSDVAKSYPELSTSWDDKRLCQPRRHCSASESLDREAGGKWVHAPLATAKGRISDTPSDITAYLGERVSDYTPQESPVIVTDDSSKLGQESQRKTEVANLRAEESKESKARPPTTLTRLLKCPKGAFFMLDFSLFRSPLFRLLLAYYLLFPCVNTMVSYLPAIASENDVTESQAALLLSLIGGLDLFCRLSCAFIANSKVVRVSTMIVFAYVILGVTAHFVRFMTSFAHFVTLSVLLGLLGGVANVLLPLLVLDFVGIDHMGKALGFVMLTCGASAAVLFPFLGYIRDITGSYTAVYHVIGSGAVLAAGCLSCEKWARRLERAKEDSPIKINL